MKIISNFKDYYDAIGAYDQDPEPIYVRRSIEIQKDFTSLASDTKEQMKRLGSLFNPSQTISHLSMPCLYSLEGTEKIRNHYYNDDIGCIFFCGRVYPFYIVSGYVQEVFKQFYCYNLNQYISAIEQLNPANKKKILSAIDSGVLELKADNHRKILNKSYLSKASWEKWTSSFNNKIEDKHARYFNCPIGVSLSSPCNVFILNPRLNQYNFQSQVEPYTAYQELSMYLGNVLVNTENTEPRPITDKDRAETKGFNEWSFRRHKTEDKKYKKQHGE